MITCDVLLILIVVLILSILLIFIHNCLARKLIKHRSLTLAHKSYARSVSLAREILALEKLAKSRKYRSILLALVRNVTPRGVSGRNYSRARKTRALYSRSRSKILALGKLARARKYSRSEIILALVNLARARISRARKSRSRS